VYALDEIGFKAAGCRGFSVDPGRAFALLSTLQLAADGFAAPPLVHPER
jgi:hypothetical protein